MENAGISPRTPAPTANLPHQPADEDTTSTPEPADSPSPEATPDPAEPDPAP
ncbi:hypothetical protein [Streptomyces bauhiniae]